MSDRYSVIPSRVWRSASGRTVSPYGALPWWNEAQRVSEGWEMVTRGWTLADAQTNTVGLCRVPFDTEAEAAAEALRLNTAWNEQRARHEREWAPIQAPITWTKARGNDGVTRSHSGEGYAIAHLAGWYGVEHEGEQLVAFRSLAKAKAWAEGCIRSDRKDRTFGAAAA